MSRHLGIRELAILTLSFSALVLGMPAYGCGEGSLQEQNSAPPVPSQDAAKAKAALNAGYMRFILTMGGDDYNWAKTSDEGKRLRPRQSYVKAAGTSEDAEETIHSIIFSAYKALLANNDQYSKAIEDQKQRAYSPDTYSRIQALVDDQSKKDMQIVERTMAQLKAALTQEDFQRLDRIIRLAEKIEK